MLEWSRLRLRWSFRGYRMHRSAPIADGKMFVCGKWNSKYLYDFNMKALQRTNFMNRNMAMLCKYTSKMYRWPCNCYKDWLTRKITSETCSWTHNSHLSDIHQWRSLTWKNVERISNRFYWFWTSGISCHAACAWILITWTNDVIAFHTYQLEDEKSGQQKSLRTCGARAGCKSAARNED